MSDTQSSQLGSTHKNSIIWGEAQPGYKIVRGPIVRLCYKTAISGQCVYVVCSAVCASLVNDTGARGPRYSVMLCHVLVSILPLRLIPHKVHENIELFNLQRASPASDRRNFDLNPVHARTQRHVVDRLSLSRGTNLTIHDRFCRGIDPLTIDHDKQLVLPA